MSILGVGTDLVEVVRIERAFKDHGQRFAERILHATELENYHKTDDKVAWLATCFAVKEAVSKALGTGIAQGVSWRNIAYIRVEKEAPTAILHEAALSRFQCLGASALHVSLSHDAGLVQSFAVLSK